MLILLPVQMTKEVLLLVGHKLPRRTQIGQKKKIRLVQAEFGKTPSVLCSLWNDLQTTDVIEAKVIDPNHDTLVKFLWTNYWLKSYPSEEAMESRTHWCDKTIRKRIKAMVLRIAALRATKIVWPASWNDPRTSPTFLISVDGVHCPIQEPTKNHQYSKNPKYYSHKFQRSALAYEVGISIFTNQIVWINGPFPAGTGDPDIFAMALKNQIPPGKKVVADSAYRRGAFPMVSTDYFADTPAVKLFKCGARARQESFFGRMKVYDVLNKSFRHGEDYHKIVFDACAVICQYQIDQVPLFDV